MYRGFDVETEEFNQHYYNTGLQLFNTYEKRAIRVIDKFIGVNGIINGSDLQDHWFGGISSHIFISHSHNDKRLAIGLAGYLYEKFKLECFVDSCIWGYSNKLLRQIDNEYCKNINNNNYNYELRNLSTSHVHIMLSTALNKMIDNCETLFFINTPNSLITSELVDETYSPWIYFELSTSKIIEKKKPARLLLKESEIKRFSNTENLNESFKIKYKTDLNDFPKLTMNEIKTWGSNYYSSHEEALDGLYEMKPPPKKA